MGVRVRTSSAPRAHDRVGVRRRRDWAAACAWTGATCGVPSMCPAVLVETGPASWCATRASCADPVQAGQAQDPLLVLVAAAAAELFVQGDTVDRVAPRTRVLIRFRSGAASHRTHA